MNQRELVIRLDGTGVDGDVGTILVYHQGEDFSIVATSEDNGDAEVILAKSAIMQLTKVLLQTLEMNANKEGQDRVNLTNVIISQYQASLEMLKQTITKCPESLWNDPDDKTKFWHIAYHVLFYTHLYLQDSEQTFSPWIKHRKEYQFLGPLPWSPHTPPHIDEPYDKDSILEYLTFCQQQVAERVPQLNLEAASGFDWLPFDKLELQIYTIRHLQQHAGELMERLGTHANVEIDWVGMKHD